MIFLKSCSASCPPAPLNLLLFFHNILLLQDLVKRVQLGEEIPEMKNLQGESFSSRVEEPKECSQE